MARGRKNGRPDKVAKSATRADSLRGRKPTREPGRKCPRRAENPEIVRTVLPDTTLKRLPRDFFNVVFRRKSEVLVRRMHGPFLDIKCSDCQQRLAIDSDLQNSAESKPEREARRMRYICRQCFWEYFEGFDDAIKDRDRRNA